MRHIPRFFLNHQIENGKSLEISEQQMRHSVKVLRQNVGDEVRVFNENFGEWSCKISDIKRKIVIPIKLIESPRQENGPSIACALINPNKFAIMMEKITELGVSEIFPIITEYTQFKTFNFDKIEQIIIQACEQSRRLSVPKLHESKKLSEFLSNQDSEMQILVGSEQAEYPQLKNIIQKNCVFMIGPEGGFSKFEENSLKKYSNISLFHYGSNILRSETAAAAFIASWQLMYS